MPRKASEVGACKELEGHIFTIGSGNKGKDGDMLRTSMEKMTTYIGTKFGDEAAQEWISGKKIVPTEPTYSLAIKARHAARVKATKDRIDLRLRAIGDSQLCFLRFDSMKSTMCLLDGGTHYHREAHRILQ
jgi:hypothetical protein